MSIATKRGDGGQTSLVGHVRVSKASLRVETCGSVDELNSAMGFARSICEDVEVNAFTKAIQRELFAVGSALASPDPSGVEVPEITSAMIDRLTEEVHRLESLDGVLADWSIPGEHPVASAYDVARTACRRAERCVIRLGEEGEAIPPNIIAYLNRLSDLLWLFGRIVEVRAGIDSSLRGPGDRKGRWSRAW
jgi:cob(I)alamin adenosyltransferase